METTVIQNNIKNFIKQRQLVFKTLAKQVENIENVNTQRKQIISESPYYEQYYCGTDVQIFINGQWFDSITTFQYGLTNNKSPLYGYASQYFDAVAKGTIIVQGQIGIVLSDMDEFNKILKNESKAIDQHSYIQRRDVSGKVYDTWIKPDGFDIIINYGDLSTEYRGGTRRKINSCHITNETSFVEISENVVMVVYNFFGQCFDDAKEQLYTMNTPVTLVGKETDLTPKNDYTMANVGNTVDKSVASIVKGKSVISSHVTDEQLASINANYPNGISNQETVTVNGVTKQLVTSKNADVNNELIKLKSAELSKASTDDEKNQIIEEFRKANTNKVAFKKI